MLGRYLHRSKAYSIVSSPVRCGKRCGLRSLVRGMVPHHDVLPSHGAKRLMDLQLGDLFVSGGGGLELDGGWAVRRMETEKTGGMLTRFKLSVWVVCGYRWSWRRR
ncbi:hypothetical protein Salat_1101600 [Sesamum alatum]|uniref:Uncharacterized protein n=1 Tax=Sesamum alatum TaxID=300844 RepID=A0AAE1YPJ7_9LAMI|nr:hypothetical protein Salat_1101600 [Sesamum alatum]